MITWKSWRWTVAGVAGAALTLLSPCALAQESEKNVAEEKETRKVETKVVVIDGADDEHRRPFLEMIGSESLECEEANGKKICVAKLGEGDPGHRMFAGKMFAGTFLGVELTETTPELREHLGGPRDAGVLLSRIEEESPAAQAGLRVGDIVTSVDGEEVESARDLRHAIASREAGDAVTIELYRDGRLEQVTATLAKREPPDFVKQLGLLRHVDGEAIAEQVREALAGIDLEDLNEDVRKQLESVDWEEIREAVREALDRALVEEDER